nr:hypothetical protein VW1E2_00048 [Enterobacter sp.]
MSQILIFFLLLIVFCLSIRLRASLRSISSLEHENKTLLANQMISHSFLSGQSSGCMGRVLKNIKNSIIQLEQVLNIHLEQDDPNDDVNEFSILNVFYSYCDQLISLTRILDELTKHPENAEFYSMSLKIHQLFKGYNFRERALLILDLLKYDSQSSEHTRMISLISILEAKLTYINQR